MGLLNLNGLFAWATPTDASRCRAQMITTFRKDTAVLSKFCASQHCFTLSPAIRCTASTQSCSPSVGVSCTTPIEQVQQNVRAPTFLCSIHAGLCVLNRVLLARVAVGRGLSSTACSTSLCSFVLEGTNSRLVQAVKTAEPDRCWAEGPA